MPLTIALNANSPTTAGAKTRVDGTATFDSAYLTGGEALTAADIGLRTIDTITFEIEDAYQFQYNYTDALVLAYYSSLGVLAARGTVINSTTATTTQILTSVTIPANLLNGAGQGLEYDFWGTTAANASTKTELVTFGTTLLVSTGTTAQNDVAWHLAGKLMYVGVSTQDGIGSARTGTVIQALTKSSGGDIMTASNTLACQAVTDVSAQSVLTGYVVKLINPVTTTGGLVQVLSGTDLSAAVVRFTAFGV